MSNKGREGGVFTGNQNAGVINNVAGNQTIYGGQRGTFESPRPEIADVETIRQLLRKVPLTEDDRASAAQAVDQLHQELSKPEPSKPKAAAALNSLTTVLQAAGVLAGAGLALVDPIGRIAVALGGAAASVLKAIGR